MDLHNINSQLFSLMSRPAHQHAVGFSSSSPAAFGRTLSSILPIFALSQLALAVRRSLTSEVNSPSNANRMDALPPQAIFIIAFQFTPSDDSTPLRIRIPTLFHIGNSPLVPLAVYLAQRHTYRTKYTRRASLE